MARKLRVMTKRDMEALQYAEMHLKESLKFVKIARAGQTAKKVRSAIKSLGGAIRHAANDAHIHRKTCGD